MVCNTGVTMPPPGIEASVIGIPASVDEGLMGFTCEHNKAPWRAPEGKGLVCLLTMTEWAEQLMNEDDETVVKLMRAAADKVMPGFSDAVDYTHVTRWDPVVVYSRAGLYKELREFDRRRPRDSRIQLGGIYFSSSNICTATTAGSAPCASSCRCCATRRSSPPPERGRQAHTARVGLSCCTKVANRSAPGRSSKSSSAGIPTGERASSCAKSGVLRTLPGGKAG